MSEQLTTYNFKMMSGLGYSGEGFEKSKRAMGLYVELCTRVYEMRYGMDVYDVTWNDPTIFTAPWSARLDWRRNDDYQFFEYACHEGNVQVRGYISSSRAERAEKQEGAQ